MASLGKGKQEAVKRQTIFNDEFDLPASQKVAKYDGPDLAVNYNSKTKPDSRKRRKLNVFRRCYESWLQGIWGYTSWYIVFYIFIYYVFNIVVIQWYCARDYAAQHTQANTAQQLMIDANKGCNDRPVDFDNRSQALTDNMNKLKWNDSICLDYDLRVMSWAAQEPLFTRLLTFLIGFYVSFTIKQWWSQVTSIPRIDNICLKMEGFMSCANEKHEGDVFLKEGLTVTELKKTVARYCLLSWAMCMSMVSAPLRKKLDDPKNFNFKHLLTYDEYQELATAKSSKGSNVQEGDVWKKKWTIPLLWANSMLTDAHSKAADTQDFIFKDFKEVIKEIGFFQDELHRVHEMNINNVPDLLTQALLIGIYFWYFWGMVSAQGLINKEHNIHIVLALIMNIPILQIMKYMVMMGWVRAAFSMQQPFGCDE